MSDPIDQGDAARELLLEVAIAAARRPAQQAPAQTNGECVNCGETATEGARWCSKDCHEEHERRERIRRRQGMR